MAKKAGKKTAKTAGKPAGKATAGAAAGTGARSGKLAASSVRDERTKEQIRKLGGSIVTRALSDIEPTIGVPTRSASNTIWDQKSRILRMGDAAVERQLFNLGMARKFMQTLLHAQGIQDLIAAGKTSSLRGLFYRGLHSIKDEQGKATKEKTFNDQTESDGILEDLEVVLGSLREELHLYAEPRGTLAGNITFTDSGDTIDARRMGSGGYSIPSIVEPEVIQFVKCEAEFVLHVEKGTVWQRFNEDRFWEKHNCVLMHGSGQPPRGVRRLLQRLNKELGLPIVCLLDCDPWGHYIYSVIKQGSMSLSFESERLAIPDAKFLGIRAKDYEQCELSDDVQIALNDRDIQRAKQIAEYPWFAGHKGWQREIRKLLDNGFKMEVESLITKDISYVTETYVPERLEARDWLE